jgi:hypothetical protein
VAPPVNCKGPVLEELPLPSPVKVGAAPKDGIVAVLEPTTIPVPSGAKDNVSPATIMTPPEVNVWPSTTTPPTPFPPLPPPPGPVGTETTKVVDPIVISALKTAVAVRIISVIPTKLRIVSASPVLVVVGRAAVSRPDEPAEMMNVSSVVAGPPMLRGLELTRMIELEAGWMIVTGMLLRITVVVPGWALGGGACSLFSRGGLG